MSDHFVLHPNKGLGIIKIVVTLVDLTPTRDWIAWQLKLRHLHKLSPLPISIALRQADLVAVIPEFSRCRLVFQKLNLQAVVAALLIHHTIANAGVHHARPNDRFGYGFQIGIVSDKLFRLPITSDCKWQSIRHHGKTLDEVV